MKSPKLVDTIRSLFQPGSGKRRKGRSVPVKVSIPATERMPVYPPRPSTPPPVPDMMDDTLSDALDYMAVERMVMDKLASDGLGALASFRDMYRMTVSRGEDSPKAQPYGTITGRVVIRSANPEMDAWVTRTPKKLIRQSDVHEVSPTVFPTTGTPGLRLVLSSPAVRAQTPAPVSQGSQVGARLLVAAGSRTADPEDTVNDMLVTDAWRGMFASDTAHLCRACHTMSSGAAHADGTWTCSACMITGWY